MGLIHSLTGRKAQQSLRSSFLSYYKAVERLWVEHVLNAPQQDVVEISKQLSSLPGFGRLTVEILPIKVAVKGSIRKTFGLRRFQIKLSQNLGGATFFTAAHEFLHYLQYQNRKVRVNFLPRKRAVPLLNRLSTNYMFECLGGDRTTAMRALIADARTSILQHCRIFCLNERQAHGLTLKHALTLKAPTEEIENTSYNNPFYRRTLRLIRDELRSRGLLRSWGPEQAQTSLQQEFLQTLSS